MNPSNAVDDAFAEAFASWSVPKQLRAWLALRSTEIVTSTELHPLAHAVQQEIDAMSGRVAERRAWLRIAKQLGIRDTEQVKRAKEELYELTLDLRAADARRIAHRADVQALHAVRNRRSALNRRNYKHTHQAESILDALPAHAQRELMVEVQRLLIELARAPDREVRFASNGRRLRLAAALEGAAQHLDAVCQRLLRTRSGEESDDSIIGASEHVAELVAAAYRVGAAEHALSSYSRALRMKLALQAARSESALAVLETLRASLRGLPAAEAQTSDQHFPHSGGNDDAA